MGGVIGIGIATLGADGVVWGWKGVSQVFAAWVIAPAIAGCFDHEVRRSEAKKSSSGWLLLLHDSLLFRRDLWHPHDGHRLERR